jgi:nicotinamide-nucleotide amidase
MRPFLCSNALSDLVFGRHRTVFDEVMRSQSEDLLQALRDAKLKIATAESCTGGLIAGLLTEIAGSSDVVERGFVTYSNEAKNECLGVPSGLLETYGAVSEEVARAMAMGAVHRSRANIAVAVTGVAGPGGGSEEKPVGLVHVAVARSRGQVTHKRLLLGDIGRAEVREATVREALSLVAASI